MDLRGSRAHKIGQILGTLDADITQDSSRSLWWLLNAPQATSDVVLEQALARSQPELYRPVWCRPPRGPGQSMPMTLTAWPRPMSISSCGMATSSSARMPRQGRRATASDHPIH